MSKSYILSQTVHVITWDNVEYDREATSWEIAKYKKEGIAKETRGGLVFDFR